MSAPAARCLDRVIVTRREAAVMLGVKPVRLIELERSASIPRRGRRIGYSARELRQLLSRLRGLLGREGRRGARGR